MSAARVFAAGGGLARHRDLRAAGVSRRALRRMLARGELRVVAPRLYACTDDPSVGERERAAVLALGGVLSHESAALSQGLEVVAAPERPHVTVGRDRSRVRRDVAQVHRADVPSSDLEEVDGVQRTVVLRTLLDLARSRPTAEAVATMDSALRSGQITLEELVGGVRELPVGPGRRKVALAVSLVHPAAGSVLESLCRVLLALAGLRPPRTQLGIAGVGRVDFAWPELRLVVETDGYAWHSDRAQYRRDRRRGNALVLAGWRVLRFSWEDVVGDPDHVVASVRALVDPSAHDRSQLLAA